jgi:hypothetical protein
VRLKRCVRLMGSQLERPISYGAIYKNPSQHTRL